MTEEDLYEVLGVPRDATQDQIKTAYKKMALRWHPDKVEASQRELAQKKFQDIQHAYDVLKDPQSRKDYDLYGDREPGAGFGDGADSGAGAGAGGYSGGGSYPGGGGYPGGGSYGGQAFGGSGDGQYEFTPEDFADFFNSMGGMGGMPGGRGGMGGMPGGNGGARMGPRGPQSAAAGEPSVPPVGNTGVPPGGKTKDGHFSIEVNLRDLYDGKIVKLQETRDKLCAKCGGRGVKKTAQPTVCPECDGQGLLSKVQNLGGLQIHLGYVACAACKGKGSYYKKSAYCTDCKGTGLTKETKVLEFDIPRGASNEGHVTLKGMSDERYGCEPGDVILDYTLKKSSTEEIFDRQGDNLYTKVSLPLVDCLCGFDRKHFVQTIDGRWLSVTMPPGKVIRPNDCVVIPNEGMPVQGTMKHGDLFVGVQIEFPKDNWMLEKNDVNKLRSILDISYGSKSQSHPAHGAHVPHLGHLGKKKKHGADGADGDEEVSDEEEDDATKVSYQIKDRDELPTTFNSFNANTEVKVGKPEPAKHWYSNLFG